tara:strand:+ start:183 stop:2000 length:1818 start_codon:yes stop_codon:yes gene_type:complete
MCGILGYTSLKKENIDKFPIKKILNTLKHRGPDSSKYIKMKNCYFGHTRLSIIGLNERKAFQPVFRGDKALTFNGEIYNYKEISKKLNKSGIRDSGKSDTETLFNCLNFYGLEKTLSIIDGMYAFAYHDQSKNLIYIVRDRIGEKPLYWSKNSSDFMFASEMKSIFYSDIFKNSPNIDKMHEIFFHGKIHGKETAFSKIFELEPGTFIELNTKNNSYSVKNYWNIDDINISDPNFIMDEFEDRFNNCIKSRLTSDVPVGSLISGGIDSSSLVYKMLELGNFNEIKLFFAQNSIGRINEAASVNIFFNFLRSKFKNKRINLNILKNKISDYWKNIEKIAYYNDEPCSFTNFHLVYGLSKVIKKNNLKVIFSGEGSDEIFFGYERYRRTDLSFEKNKNNIESIFFGHSINHLNIIESILGDKSIIEKVKASNSWLWLNEIMKKFDLNTAQFLFSQKYRLLGLLQRQDRASMAHGVESRAPFLMPSFVRWVNSLPMSYKYNNKIETNKLILRKYMSNYLHPKITNRKKMGFENDFDYEFKKKQFQKNIISIISERDSFTSNYLNVQAILKILKNKKLIYKYQSIIKHILNVEIWYKVFYRKNYFLDLQ